MFYDKLIESKLKDNGNKTAIIYQEREYSYREINRLVCILGSKLKELGIKKGDRVIIINNNSIEMVISILTSIALGIIFVPLPYDIGIKRLNFIKEDCNAKRIIVMDKLRDEEIASCENILCVKDVLVEADNKEFIREHVSEDEGVYIIYTSGTTNKPKGVFACQKQAIFASDAISSCLKNTSDDTILCRIPLSFDYGLYQLFMSCIAGAKLLLLGGDVILQSIPYYISKYNVTAFPVVPAMLNILVKSRLFERVEIPTLRYISSTGDALPVDLIKQAEKQLPNVEVIPMYGLTECKRVSIMPYGMKEKKYSGSCGIPLPGVEVRLVNKNGEIGELEVIGPNVMEGYWNDEEETEKFYRVEDGKKVLKTGDLFKVDDDGFLYFQGRKKSFIKYNGYRISNLELEEIVGSVENVIENAVVGISDTDVGEDIVCVAYLDDLTKKDQVKKDCANRMGGIKIKKFIFIDKPLPKNSNGKVDRKLIKSNIEAQK